MTLEHQTYINSKIKAVEQQIKVETGECVKLLFIVDGDAPDRTTELNLICNSVALYFGITVQEMKSHCRKKEFVIARSLATGIFLERYSTLTYVKIGQYFGGRDHSTVTNSMKLHNALLENNRDYKWDYSRIKEQTQVTNLNK